MIKVPLKVTYGILTALDLALRSDTSPVQAKVIARRQNIQAFSSMQGERTFKML